jgi:enoyl-CoA hydratase/carnithine racemase
MLGSRIDAPTLHTHGLINRLCENGSALHTALALAEQLNQRAPNALSSIKELLQQARSNSLTQQLACERDAFVNNLHHPNAGIGIAAFLGKTQAHYE